MTAVVISKDMAWHISFPAVPFKFGNKNFIFLRGM
jgi:hypothetical protein